jgi:arginyl-tRNA synthetase
MKTRLRLAIRNALATRFGLTEPDQPDFSLEAPAHEAHGDLASNVAMLLARPLKRAPKAIAAELAEDLAGLDFVERIEVAGPGFLNAFLRPEAWQSVLLEVLEQGPAYGRSESPASEPVMVEFVSANPTGPLHFGHGRGAVVGDVLANLLEFSGRQVTREFYVNDAGRQVRNLALSIVWWLKKDRGIEAEFPEDGYQGDYVADLARALPAELATFLPGEPEEGQLEAVQAFGVETMLAGIRRDLDAFGVRMDRFASERELLGSSRLAETFAELDHRGVLEDRDGARWFLSDRFGDEKPRVLVKSNGDNTYFATDVAYHLDKLRRGFGLLINVWGADHHGYVPRMKAALQALGRAPEALDVVLVQMVSLLRDGQPVVMSKRAGEITTLREVFEEVGRDAARFFFLLRGSDSQMEFDLELAKRRSLDNPVFYVQYGHARLASLLAKAVERGIEVPAPAEVPQVDLSSLTHPGELRLIKKLSLLGEMVQRSADSRAPHQLVFYLQDLVAEFHSYYTATKSSGPLLKGDPGAIRARLILVQALRQVLSNALGLLGVSAPDRMESPEGEGEAE